MTRKLVFSGSPATCRLRPERNRVLDGDNHRLIVRGNGKELFRSNVHKGHTERRLDLDLAGIRVLELTREPEG